MSKTQPARGMRDFLPADIRKRNYVIGIIKEVYESYGFEPLETPAVENLETLTGKYGEEGNQLMFRILKRGEKLDISQGETGLSDLALRYDLTVPLARVVANYRNDLPRFFKRYQIQPVWRADRPARGRFREFYQCDVDAIGSNSMMVEAELCAAVNDVLQKLNFENFRILLNHRKILFGILEVAQIPLERQVDTLVVLDKLDKIGREGIIKELGERGLTVELIDNLMGIFDKIIFTIPIERVEENAPPITQYDVSKTKLKTLEDILTGNAQGCEGIEELRDILENTKNLKISEKIIIEPFLVRGLSYYTGAIFEINVPDLAGSLGGGGRYDGLIGMFGKEQIPACGFSLGLERILVVMNERGMFPPELQTNSADVLVTVWDEKTVGESLKLANELRQTGLRVLVYPQADKPDKQLKYASQINVPFVCLLGDDELRENKVTLKNMQKREQETVSREEIAEKIRIALGAKAGKR